MSETIKSFGEKINELTQLFFRVCFLPSLLCYVFVELCSRKSAVDLFLYFIRDPFVFFYNAFLISATASVCLLFRRRSFVLSIVLFLWAAIGVTDMVLLAFRTTPFTAVDLLMLKNAFQIMHRYLTPFQMVLIGAAFLAVVALCVWLWKYCKKSEGSMDYLFRIPFCAALLGLCLLFTQLGLATKILDRNFGNLANAFHENGLPYCFMNSLLNTGVAKPDGYSPEQVIVIIEGMEEPKEETAPYPNILFLQLESFFDPKLIENTDSSVPGGRL